MAIEGMPQVELHTGAIQQRHLSSSLALSHGQGYACQQMVWSAGEK